MKHDRGKTGLKRPFIVLLLLTVCPVFLFAQQGTPSTLNVRGAEYPMVMPDKRVVFKIRAPETAKLQIDLGKRYPMTRDNDGFWTVTTDPQGPGFHYYSLIVSGLATADPAAYTFYGMSRMASGVEIPFPGDDFYALKDVPHGEIRYNRYFSGVTDSWRRMLVYTPPGYNTDINKRYPVLYILHGGGEDERGWADQGFTDRILDNLIAEKKAVPMLIVMMDGNVGNGPGQDSYQRFEAELLTSIIPFVENNYRTKTDADSRALAGLSMGGLQTLAAGIPHTDKFHFLGIFSSGWFADRPMEATTRNYEYMAANANKIKNDLNVFFFAVGGEEDGAHVNTEDMKKRLDGWGIPYSYYSHPGGHTWPVWRHNLFRFAQELFQQK